MKKYILLTLSIMVLFLGKEVLAKDTVYSLNKYSEEELNYIIENNKSIVVAGTVKEEKKSTKVVIIDYSKDGDINWKYVYKAEQDLETNGIVNTPDGYLLVVNDSNGENLLFLVVDLEGKLLLEKNIQLASNVNIEKIIEENNNYLIVGSKENHAFLAKFDSNLELVWLKEYQEENTNLKNIIYVDSIGYYGVLETKIEKDSNYQIIKYDLNGDAINQIKTNFETTIEPHLENVSDSYAIYGITNQVKLEDKSDSSYYLVKFSKEDEEEWETIGNDPVDSDSILKLQTITNDKENYIITYNSNGSFETIRLDSEGVLQEKIKKLKNNYYKINDFLLSKNTLYYVGQINCPEDDNCDYNANSLLLVSSEDKVIEVKDKDSRSIIIVFIVIITVGIIAYITRKKHILKKH